MSILRGSDRFVCCLIGALLIVGNVLVLLPWQFSLGVLVRWPMAPPVPRIDQHESGDMSIRLVVSDPSGIVSGAPGVQRKWPIPAIETRLNRRRINHLVDVGRIALIAESPSGERAVVVSWPAEELWAPNDQTPIRFVLPNLDPMLSPGRYEVYAMLYAEPPWGVGALPDSNGTREPDEWKTPAWPGQFLVYTAETDRIVIDVTVGPSESGKQNHEDSVP